jgi:hypothetical protein
MPSARADEFRRVAAKLGFLKARQTGATNDGGILKDEPQPSRFTADRKSAHHFLSKFQAAWSRPEEVSINSDKVCEPGVACALVRYASARIGPHNLLAQAVKAPDPAQIQPCAILFTETKRLRIDEEYRFSNGTGGRSKE